MKKICIISTSRADYHLLKNVIKKIQLSKKLTPYLIVSGSHLEKRFGNIKVAIGKLHKEV